MRSHIGLGLLLTCLAAVSLPGIATAEDPPCLADVKQFCAEVPVGGGRIQACLKEHDAQISEACRTRVDALMKEAGLAYAACRWDIGYFCSNVAPGGGRIISCLEDNKEHLSPSCASMLQGKKK